MWLYDWLHLQTLGNSRQDGYQWSQTQSNKPHWKQKYAQAEKETQTQRINTWIPSGGWWKESNDRDSHIQTIDTRYKTDNYQEHAVVQETLLNAL